LRSFRTLGISITKGIIFLKHHSSILHYFVSALLLILIVHTSSYAQDLLLKGNILDSKTNEPLPAANIIIKDSYTGTISNLDGQFELRLSSLPITILVRYIGYFTQELRITEIQEEPLIIRMQPNVRELGEVVVTGGDPALEIMREVIRRKQIWRAELQSYSAQAYTRQRLESDSKIASITETLSEVFWDKTKGSREVIKSKRQTANIGMEENFAAAGFIPNFYDDNISISGFDMVGPTHPDAFKYYDFELMGLRSLDNLKVFDIKVSSKRKLQPTFEGMIAVVDSAYALLEIDLRPNDALIFPPPIQKFDLWYTQQFSNFGGDFWLPVDVRIRGDIKFGIIGLQFPEIGIQQLSRLTDYKVNAALPDSLYDPAQRRRLRVDTVSVKMDSLFLKSPMVVPLTAIEAKAYDDIDSTKTLDKAFEPKGILARFVNANRDESNGRSRSGAPATSNARPRLRNSFRPDYRFTRVDGPYLGGLVTSTYGRRYRLTSGLGYSFSSQRLDYQVGFRYRPTKTPRMSYFTDFRSGTFSRYNSQVHSSIISSSYFISNKPDYFDYYRADQLELKAEHRLPRNRGVLGLAYLNALQTSLDKVTDYSLLRKDLIQRPNPSIEDGIMRSLTFKYSRGDELIPFSIVGQNRLEASIELSDQALFNSEYSFVRYSFKIDRRIPTFYKRRFLPNTFDIRLDAATSTGSLPLQRFGIVDATTGSYAAFGSLKTQNAHPYEGEHHLALHWEHNFRSIPFELMGLPWFARKGWGFVVYGSHARTFIDSDRLNQLKQRPDYLLSYTDSFHHEIGISLNGIFSLGRVNFTKRLDAPGYNLGFGIARYF